MVATHHDRTDLALPDQLVERQTDIAPALRILIQNACLRTDDQFVLFRVTNPDPVVSVLSAAVRVDNLHRGLIGRIQILRLAGQADPTERAVAVIEEDRSHDILYIGRPDKSVLIVITVLGDFLHTGVVHGLHEGVAIVKEVRSSFRQRLDRLVMSVQGLINFLDKVVAVFVQLPGSFLEAHTHRAVTAVIDIVAGGLVGKQVDMEIFCHRCFEQINDIAVVSDGDRLLCRELFLCQLENCIDIVHDHIDPALLVSGLYPRKVDFRENTDSIGDVGCLWLCAAHTAETRRYESMTCQIAVLRHAQLFASRVENRIKGTMYDALRPDVHPAARRHLSVVGYAHFLGDFPVVKIVIHTDHDGIGDDDTRRGWFGRKQSQRVSGFHNQGLILRQFFEIFFDEPILQPVLAYRSGLTVGNQFIWIERDVKVEIVVDHHLKSLAC